MLMHSHGFDVGDRLFLVRMHVDRDSYELVQCCDWRPVAQSLLQSEYVRLITKRRKVARDEAGGMPEGAPDA